MPTVFYPGEGAGVTSVYGYVRFIWRGQDKVTAWAKDMCQRYHETRIVQDMFNCLKARHYVEFFFQIVPGRQGAHVLYFEARSAAEPGRPILRFCQIRAVPAKPERVIPQERAIDRKPSVAAPDIHE